MAEINPDKIRPSKLKVGNYKTIPRWLLFSFSSGKSTGPHLHITYRVDGKTENPAYLIDGILKRKDEVLEKIRMVGKKPNEG